MIGITTEYYTIKSQWALDCNCSLSNLYISRLASYYSKIDTYCIKRSCWILIYSITISGGCQSLIYGYGLLYDLYFKNASPVSTQQKVTIKMPKAKTAANINGVESDYTAQDCIDTY